ncbi:MAG TPA: OmpA family protein [Lysobacter sp.]
MTAYPSLSPLRSRVAPAAVFALVVLAALSALGGCSRDSTPPASTQAQATPATPAAAQIDARLSLVNNNGTVRYDGTVGSESSRKAIVAMLGQAYGPSNVSGDLIVNPAARPAPWQDPLPQFLAAFTMPGAAITFEGERIELSGYASEPDRAALLARAQQLFPDFALTGLFRGLAGPAVAGSSEDDAAQALAGLKAGASPGELEQALNDTPIHFVDGSAQVSADSLPILSQAARAIQGNAGERRIEITGPASAGEDLALSQQRAEAIKVQLIVNGISPAAIETRGHAAGTAASGASFRLL